MPITLSEASVRTALQYISPDIPRHEWVRVAFALHSEFGDSGWSMFDDWSRGGGSYEMRAARDTWKSVRKRSSGAAGGRVTIATLISIAQQGGFDLAQCQEVSDQVKAERERMRLQAEQRREAERQARLEEERRAAMTARERWRSASRDGASAYLCRKLVARAESVRFERSGAVLVPMVRYDLPRDAALVGVQAIAPNGEKRFGRGTAKRGAACRLGCVAVGDPILVAEGYATAATLREAVQYRLPVFVAFDAGNLEPVTQILLDAYPDSPLLICADDDHATRGNPGRARALKLMRRSRVDMIYPVWTAARGPKHTDFNDLHAAEGLHVVSRQLAAPLRHLGFARPVASEMRDAA